MMAPSGTQNFWETFGLTGNPYAMKDGTSGAEMAAWPGAALPPTAGYYSYDHPTLAAYGYGGGYDLAARRKNATRESTATLKAWLNEHKKNPYPTKGEKIMLAIITKMTLTQVSTWFANARRRLKKENKMTWEPKNKLDDEDVDVSDDDDKDKDDDRDLDDHRHLSQHNHHTSGGSSSTLDDGKSGIPIPASKPKIWSLADTAVCKTPPPASNPNGQSIGHGFGHSMSSHQSSWASGFDPAMRSGAMSAFRGNAFGMTSASMAGMAGMASMAGMAGMALGGRPDFSMMGNLPTSAPSAQLPASSPSVSGLSHGSGDLQTDTPPHTPPTGKNCQPARTSSSGGYLYNGNLANGYSSNGNISPANLDPSKLLNFPASSGHLGAFKMM